jgi:RNA polymerase sigma-70 factor (ECF subfamily)
VEDGPSDAALLARVANADRDAFEVLYHRYVRSIFGLALRRLRDRAQAEEVTQEAFTAV